MTKFSSLSLIPFFFSLSLWSEGHKREIFFACKCFFFGGRVERGGEYERADKGYSVS